MSNYKTMAFMGIDLGTTNSCAGVMKDGKVEIIQSETGAHTVPSIVAFSHGDEVIVGEEAELKMKDDPEYCVYNIKSLIGRKYNDLAVEVTRENLPFEVIDDKGSIKIKVPERKGRQSYLPEEISGFVLKKMKQLAEKYLGERVNKAVITIPHHFNNKQREATKTAAEYAGLQVLRLVHEPTAVGIAYGLQEKTPTPKNVLVYDLGGGTFDVSVLTIKDSVITVKGADGDRNLGGENFDLNMMNSCIRKIATEHGTDAGKDFGVKSRLKQACRKHKEELSLDMPTSVTLEKLLDEKDFSTIFTRAQFEDLNKDHFDTTMEKLENALHYADLDKTQVDVVLLAGGSSKIPYVKDMVEEYFGKKPQKGINPDEAVAYGATLLAAQLSGNVDKQVQDFKLHDVTPLSLGTDIKGGMMSVIIPRGTKIPAEICENYTTVVDNQTSMRISIYEGERADIQLNNHMATFTLVDIPSKLAGLASVKVTFKLDFNGMLNVSAQEKETGNEKNIDIDWGCAERSKEVFAKQVEEAERLKSKDDKWRIKQLALNELESYTKKVMRLVNAAEVNSKMSQKKQRDILDKCNSILKWIEKNPKASQKDTRKKKKALQKIFGPYEE